MQSGLEAVVQLRLQVIAMTGREVERAQVDPRDESEGESCS